MGGRVSSWIIALVAILALGCAPEDRPLKGSKNHPEEDSKIKESAYYGNSVDVLSYASYRLLEPKRVLDIALKVEALDPEKEKNLGFDDLPGYELLKSCWSGKNEVLIDVLQNKPEFVQFKLKFVNCTLLSGHQVSTKINGYENYQLYFDLSNSKNKVKRSLRRVIYNTQGLSHSFKANDKHPRFSASSEAEFVENREMDVFRRSSGEFYFNYGSKGTFAQRMLSQSFRVEEPMGRQEFFSEGNFLVKNKKVIQVLAGSMEFVHNAQRSVFLKSGSERHVFDNLKNRLELQADWSHSVLNFDTECGFISGDFESVTYRNLNEKRNRFFGPLDELKSSPMKLNFAKQKGSSPELEVLDQKGHIMISHPAKCYLKSTNLVNLSQPKTPFELIFLR